MSKVIKITVSDNMDVDTNKIKEITGVEKVKVKDRNSEKRNNLTLKNSIRKSDHLNQEIKDLQTKITEYISYHKFSKELDNYSMEIMRDLVISMFEEANPNIAYRKWFRKTTNTLMFTKPVVLLSSVKVKRIGKEIELKRAKLSRLNKNICNIMNKESGAFKD